MKETIKANNVLFRNTAIDRRATKRQRMIAIDQLDNQQAAERLQLRGIQAKENRLAEIHRLLREINDSLVKTFDMQLQRSQLLEEKNTLSQGIQGIQKMRESGRGSLRFSPRHHRKRSIY